MPQGSASLKLVKVNEEDVSQRTFPSQFVDSSQQVALNSQLYRGIKVVVSFGGNAKVGDAEMQADNEKSKVDAPAGQDGVVGGRGLAHLSGGQKTVVVVALILAVLKMEAAPFYILDEFDHALDSQYRSSIAQLINELSSSSQFLITTFKPEIIKAAEAKIFEVTFKNRKSGMAEIGKDKALKIVKGEEKQAKNRQADEVEQKSSADAKPGIAA